MLRYLIIVLFAVASRGLLQESSRDFINTKEAIVRKNCSHDFIDTKDAIVNGSLGVISNISNAFFPTKERRTDYLVIRYFYALNCSNESNDSQYMDYIWTSSSVYLVVEPNAFKDLTGGVVEVNRANLTINLQCLCPSYPDDVTTILNRLTAYVSQ